MPLKPLRPCKKIGCSKLTRDKTGYCEEHRILAEQSRKEMNKYYDENIRDKRAAAFYNSSEWQRIRETVLNKYKGLDLYAFFIDKKIIYATTVHHIEEIKDNWNKRLDIDNLFPISESNHNKIHALYKKDKKGTQKMLKELLKKWNDLYG
ncbi:HNH endonuclease [Caloranaerobacter sp. DY30410]|uniref:HNH endonuclease n=1 Tax=Caloranaerobacter sp. DY30410 TaxID=3238305 RepID=UPI003CFDCCAC